MSETWLAIEEYEGHYEISNHGRVRSLRNRKQEARNTPLILKASTTSGGYLKVNLCKAGERKNKDIHRLVAGAFLDDSPLPVDHLDGIKTNNYLENLEVVTHRENSIRYRKRAESTSRYVGVCWYPSRNCWLVQIEVRGKNRHVGYYESEQQGSKAYQRMLKLADAPAAQFEKELLKVRKGIDNA